MIKSTLLAGLSLAAFLAFPAAAQEGSCTRGDASQCTRGNPQAPQGPHTVAAKGGSARAAAGHSRQSPQKRGVKKDARSPLARKKAVPAAPSCICGRPLAEGSSHFALIHHGMALVFCNEKCLAAFSKKKGKCPVVVAREAAAAKGKKVEKALPGRAEKREGRPGKEGVLPKTAPGDKKCCDGKNKCGDQDCCGKAGKAASAAGKKASGAVTCVCGSPLEEGARVRASIHGGRTLLFCSEKCLESFSKNQGSCKRDKKKASGAKARSSKGAGARMKSGPTEAGDCCKKK